MLRLTSCFCLIFFTGLTNTATAQGAEHNPVPSQDSKARAGSSRSANPGEAKEQNPSRTPQPAQQTAQSSATVHVLKDPQGVQGISPYWETLNRADALLMARDEPGAIQEYQSAISLMPKNPLAYLRLASLSLKKKNWDQALHFVLTATHLAGRNDQLKATAAFLLAEVHERQRNDAKAVQSWSAYASLQKGPTSQDSSSPQSSPPLQLHRNSAIARISAIETQSKLAKEYELVVARIKKNQLQVGNTPSSKKK